MIHAIEALLADQFACPSALLRRSGTFFTIHSTARAPHIQMLAYRSCVVVCTSADVHDCVKAALKGKSRDEIFEFPFVYGQTIHYIPDPARLQPPTLPAGFDCEMLQNDQIRSLNDYTDFDNSLSADAALALVARQNGKIIAAAGASAEFHNLFEMGVDVLPDYRNAGLATSLVRGLTQHILRQNGVPFYSASVTNIGSQMVASRCGLIPCWVDTFGNTFDGSSTYAHYLQNLHP